MNPYIGDRPLDPPDEHECPDCFSVFNSNAKLLEHTRCCPENIDADVDEEELNE